MFKPEKMFHAQVLIPKNTSNDLITALHEKGICELKQSEQNLEESIPLNEVELNELKISFSKLLIDLNEFKPVIHPENRIKELLFPLPPKKTKIKINSIQETIFFAKKQLNELKPKTDLLLNELKELKQKIKLNEFEIQNLSLLPNQPLNLLESTKNVEILFGLITKKNIESLTQKINNAVILVKEKDEKTAVIIIAFHKLQKELIEKELHSIGFESIKINFSSKKPLQLINELNQQNTELNQKIQEIRTKLINLTKNHWEKIEVMEEEINICIDKAINFKKIKTSKSFSVMEAWIPAKNLTEFKNILELKSKNYYLELNEKNDAPTLLKNPKLIQPFEMITELYSVPKYNGLDPTPVLALTFAIFFGYMLTDFFYGIILTMTAIILYKGIGKYKPTIKKFSGVLIYLGLSTIVLGAMFTSYFGDFFPRIGIQMPGLLDPLDQVVILIALSVIIGVLHLSTGLTLGFLDNIRLNKPLKAFSEQGVWLMFLIGITFLLIGNPFTLLGLIALILSIIMQIGFKFLEGGPVISLLSIFDFSGFVGDTFSYARLTALAIGTAGIALAVNFMTLLVYEMVPVIGLPLAIIVFAIGHLFNMVMNGLGSFIHSLRLHFLEFFQKFYEGGGTPYSPFHAKRNKTVGGE